MVNDSEDKEDNDEDFGWDEHARRDEDALAVDHTFLRALTPNIFFFGGRPLDGCKMEESKDSLVKKEGAVVRRDVVRCRAPEETPVKSASCAAQYSDCTAWMEHMHTSLAIFVTMPPI